VGLRRSRSGPTGLSFSAAASYARWQNVLAELVSAKGLPYTTNVGDAKIFALEATGNWVIVPGLEAESSVFFTSNRTTGALPAQSVGRDRRLPDTPPFSAAASLRYGWGRGITTYRAGLDMRYVGRSVLGPGPCSMSRRAIMPWLTSMPGCAGGRSISPWRRPTSSIPAPAASRWATPAAVQARSVGARGAADRAVRRVGGLVGAKP
jgi:hypothetical protein